MGFFGTDTIRLLRERWPNATQLAEELFAMLNGLLPITNNAPVTLQNTDGAKAPLTVQVPGQGSTLIQFTGKQGQPVGAITLGSDGQISLPGALSKSPPPPPPPPPPVSTNAFTGTVLSGTDDTYSVQLRGSITVTAKQRQFAAGTAVPAGTVVVVIRENDGSYSMHAPVWQ